MEHQAEQLIKLTDIPDVPDANYNKLLHTFMNFIQNDVIELKKSVRFLTDQNTDLENKLRKTEKRLSLSEGMITQLKVKVKSQEEMITDLKCRSMRDNLIFRGLVEENDETWDVTKKKAIYFMKNILKMPDFDEKLIDRAHRIGNKDANGPRPMVVKFLSSSLKDSVFKYVKNLKDRPTLSIQEQFPPEVQERRKRLWPMYKDAKKIPTNNVKWSTDKLIINGRVHTAKDDEQDIDPSEDDDLATPVVHTEHRNTKGNVFVGHAAQITKESEIPQVLASLMRDRIYAGASHTMYAYRIGRTATMKEACKDDREHGGGSTLLKLLKDANCTNTIVIVSRWLGEHLGPDRFNIFKECGEQALELLQT